MTVTSDGIFTAKMDFNSAVYPSDCDSLIQSGALSGQIRSFNLTFQDSTDCQILVGSTTTPCTINVGPGSSVDKIFAGSLFARGARASVLFDFRHNGQCYSLKTDSPPTVSGTGITRTATYLGGATLFIPKGCGPPKPQQIGGSFSFPFQFTVTIR